MRYAGQSYELNVPFTGDFISAFHHAHEKRYGYFDRARACEVVNIRARFTGRTPKPALPKLRDRRPERCSCACLQISSPIPWPPQNDAYIRPLPAARGKPHPRPRHRDGIQRDDADPSRMVRPSRSKRKPHPGAATMSVDPIRLEIFKNLFHSVAEEMGAALRRSAFSPNIKERRDYSCAVFDATGDVLAMGDHMPVHLGSMPMSVQAALSAFELGPGDVALLNDPYAGGTHLPDLTMVMPVFAPRSSRPLFYIANRAHHADIGGAHAGSMGLSREIFEEGLRIPPVKIMERGRIARDVMAILLANVRTPREREGDLTAQIAACRIGERRLMSLVAKYGSREVIAYGRHLLDYSARMMAATIAAIPGWSLPRRRFSGRRWRDGQAAAHRRHDPHSREKCGGRFYGKRAAMRGQRQRRRSHHGVRRLLRFPVPAG